MLTIGTKLRNFRSHSCLPPSEYFSLLLLGVSGLLSGFAKELSKSPCSSIRASWSVRKEAYACCTHRMMVLKMISEELTFIDHSLRLGIVLGAFHDHLL